MKTTEPKPDQPEPENPLAFPQGFATSNDGAMYASWEKHPDFGGMTLRDYFAAKAMAALIRNYSSESDFAAFSVQAKESGLSIPALLAGMAYENADAMLLARKEQP